MKSTYSKINKELNELEIYKNLKCKDCGRRYPETILNIEEMMHHNGNKYRCVNRQDCNQAKKKLKL